MFIILITFSVTAVLATTVHSAEVNESTIISQGLAWYKSGEYILSDEIVQQVNNNPNTSWLASRNKRFEGIALKQAKSLLNTMTLTDIEKEKLTTPTHIINRDLAENKKVGKSPTNFDSRIQWPGCVGAIRNQERCGGCWAFGAAETLSDRFCIATNGKINVTLSPQDLLSCGHVRTPPKYMLGCNGGVPEYAWKYLVTTGISTDECIPFVSKMGNETEVCPVNQPCDSNKYKVKVGSTRLLDGAGSAAQQYMSDPISGGPIQAVFYVYNDFFHYKSGIYKHTNMTQTPLGKHSIKVIGYGVDKLHGDYWIAANSWGTEWGMGGFFNIVSFYFI